MSCLYRWNDIFKTVNKFRFSGDFFIQGCFAGSSKMAASWQRHVRRGTLVIRIFPPQKIPQLTWWEMDAGDQTFPTTLKYPTTDIPKTQVPASPIWDTFRRGRMVDTGTVVRAEHDAPHVGFLWQVFSQLHTFGASEAYFGFTLFSLDMYFGLMSSQVPQLTRLPEVVVGEPD